MATVLITGCAQGIGLEFARQYAFDGWHVIAVTRRRVVPAVASTVPGKVEWHRADISRPAEVQALGRRLAGRTIDLLVNNAGIHGPADFGKMDVKAWLKVLRINLIGTMLLTEAVLPCIRRSSDGRIAFISSRGGSIAERGSRPYHRRGGSYVYRCSKAALNAAARSLAFDLAPEGVRVLVLHPGFITTSTSGEVGTDEISDNVGKMRKRISEMPPAEGARFLDFEGVEIPW